jgi:hypothetical protein
VDVKIPLFPTSTPREGFALLSMVAKKRGLAIPDALYSGLESRIPSLLTPGAAEALVMNLYRHVRTTSSSIEDILNACLAEYQNPIPPDVMAFQIQLAASEATALEFVPTPFRNKTLH